jgi:hypothetical protein
VKLHLNFVFTISWNLAADGKISSIKPRAPEIQKPNTLDQGVQADAGEDLEIRLPFTGKPSPRLTVYRDDVRIHSKEHLSCKVESDEIVLRIQDATAQDSGLYTVVAENDAGSDEADIRIKISG